MYSNKIKSSLLLSIDQVSTRLTNRFSAGRDLDSFARGIKETFLPRNKQEYDLYRRYMHDILCLAMLDYGYYDEEEFTASKFGISTNDYKLNNQKPDLYKIEQDVIRVCEVTFTFDPEKVTREKTQRYDEFFVFMESQLHKRISFKVLCIDLTDSEWEDTMPEILPMYKKMITTFVNNLRIIHSSTNGLSYKGDVMNYSTDRFTFQSDHHDMSKIMKEICGADDAYIKFRSLLNSESSYKKDNLTNDEYLTEMAHRVLNAKRYPRPRPHPESKEPTELINDWNKFKSIKPTTEKLPVILQLGMPNLTREQDMTYSESIQFLTNSTSFGGYLDLIKQSLQNEDPDDNHMIRLNLSQSQLEQEQLSGPGKKHYIKIHGLKLDRKPPTHIGVDVEHTTMLNDFMSKIDVLNPEDFVKDIDFPTLESCGQSMMNNLNRIYTLMMSSGSSYLLRFYQRVSQEIILNSMRRRKRHQYALCYSGFKGIYVLIAPGPQLRTESNVIFVKIISLCAPISHQLSREWHTIGDHWESDWISVDTDRLKHWSRAFDRVYISLIGGAERLVEPGLNILEAVRMEVSLKNYCMMSLTFLENKQLTSTTNQTIRYLWMKALGDKQFKGIMSKFPDRVSSVIQSTMLQRSINQTIHISTNNLSNFLSVNQLVRDEDIGTLDETTTGVLGKLPRLFTEGGMVPISYNLNEIYWCMMYNKDRQNVTQDSMKILAKILKEEVKFNEELNNCPTVDAKSNFFLGNTTVEQDVKHVTDEKPDSHYYSMRAVQIGLDYQDKHEENTCPSSTWLTANKLEQILNRNLSEYATFKASVKFIKDKIDQTELDEVKEIGKRTKCIELVYEMVHDEGLKTASEVAMQFSGINNENFNIIIQIFKKNQVGGVREILILFIKARIMINIIEELCRLLSKADKREILTKGKDKRLMMRADFEELSSAFPKGTPLQIIRNSYDMSTWCQKFIPIIFAPIFSKHLKSDSLVDYATFILIKHCDKSIEYPMKLVEQWVKHPELSHEQSSVQKYKEIFQSNGVTSFKNRSNMGQGILHYCSTVLALSAQSFRDALFKRCLKLLNVQQKIRWKTRVGSDDKGELVAVDMTDKSSYAQYLLLEQCAHTSERLHAMELSVKSASGNIIYELNSAFMSNLETLSPIIKFTMAATDLISTSSCTQFVNESYSRIRQLRENGASSLLCGMAHILNSDHFYTVFRTGDAMVNDPRTIFQIPETLIPYDFGVYPFYDIDIQDMIGPEYYNYQIFTDKRCSEDILKLLYTDLTPDKTGQILPNEDTSLFKKDHFGISQGLVRQLANMRKRLNLEPETIMEFLKNNPFMIVRGPETVDETANIIAAKLYTKGAAESLRRTSPAIYIGRLSAFESAKAWSLIQESNNAMGETLNEEFDDEPSRKIEHRNLTYKEFLELGFKYAKQNEFDKEANLELIFPQHQSFEVVRQFVGKFGVRSENKRKYSQAVRTWTLNNYNYNFSNSLRGILETSFGFNSSSSMDDVHELRKLINIDLSSYENLIHDCMIKGIRPLDLFFYMSKLFKNISISKPQVFASGPSTTSLNLTLINIKRFNHLPNSTMYIEEAIDDDLSSKENTIDKIMDNLKFCFNISMMRIQGSLKFDGAILSQMSFANNLNLKDYCTTQIRNIKSISGYDRQTKKIIIYLSSLLLDKSELKERLIKWKTLNYTYIKTQTKTFNNSGKVSWTGDLKLLVNSGNDCFTYSMVKGKHFLESLRLTDLDSLYSNLFELCKMLEFDFRSIFTKRKINYNEIYLKNKKLYRSQVTGDVVDVLNLHEFSSFPYYRIQDFDQFSIRWQIGKDHSVKIFLEEGSKRSATICHFPGHYYPTPVPINLTVPEDAWLSGVRLGKLMMNREWFFNARLPVMNNKQAIEFLKEDVKFDVILKQQEDVKTRIADYMSIHEEINEEAFNYNLDNELIYKNLKPKKIPQDDMLTEGNFFEMFETAMNDELVNSHKWNEPILDWAEEVERESSDDGLTFEDLTSGAYLNEGISYARALGLKKPSKRRNFFSITNLQQGSLLKTRVLDMFFCSGSILSENRSSLPYYCLWLMTNKELSSDLRDSLLKHIKSYITYTTGASEGKLNQVLMSANVNLAKPIDRVQNYIHGFEQSLWELIDANNEKYDVDDSDIDDE